MCRRLVPSRLRLYFFKTSVMNTAAVDNVSTSDGWNSNEALQPSTLVEPTEWISSKMRVLKVSLIQLYTCLSFIFIFTWGSNDNQEEIPFILLAISGRYCLFVVGLSQQGCTLWFVLLKRPCQNTTVLIVNLVEFSASSTTFLKHALYRKETVCLGKKGQHKEMKRTHTSADQPKSRGRIGRKLENLCRVSACRPVMNVGSGC